MKKLTPILKLPVVITMVLFLWSLLSFIPVIALYLNAGFLMLIAFIIPEDVIGEMYINAILSALSLWLYVKAKKESLWTGAMIAATFFLYPIPFCLCSNVNDLADKILGPYFFFIPIMIYGLMTGFILIMVAIIKNALSHYDRRKKQTENI